MTVSTTPPSLLLSTLTVPNQQAYEKDLLLRLYVSKAHPFVKVETAPKDGSLALHMGVVDAGAGAGSSGSLVVTQRNTILRALASMYDSQRMVKTASARSALCVASAQEWMSVSRNQVTEPSFLQRLNSHLENYSFLSEDSATASLADFHVALVLLQQQAQSPLATDASSFPHVLRWLRQCHAELAHYSTQLKGTVLPDLLESIVASQSPVLPVFYNGTEDLSAVLQKSSGPLSPKGKGAPQEKQQANAQKNQQGKNNKQSGKQQQQQQQPAKKKQAQQPQQTPADYDISALDIRVGKIIKVWPHEEAEKLYCEEIDMGNGEIRKICSGLRSHYASASDLQDKLVLVVCNLKARPMKGFPSHGMVLCAVTEGDTEDARKVQLVIPPEGTKIGESVSFEGFMNDKAEPENKVAKKKILEKVAPDLKTDASGVVNWKGAKATTSAGTITSSFANAQVS